MKYQKLMIAISVFLVWSTAVSAFDDKSYNESIINLDSFIDQFKDVLQDYHEQPSDLYKPGQIKSYLSSPMAIQLRKDLGQFRDEMTKKYYEERKKRHPDYITLSQEMTKRYVAWIRQYIKTAIPDGVNDHDFALIAFGSLGRQEIAGPYTDLEAAILVKDTTASSLAMGRKIAESISYRFNQTGENPKLPLYKKGFRPDEESNFPFNLAMHAKGLVDREAYCLAYKSLPPEKPGASDADGEIPRQLLKKWKHEKENNKKYYPFEGAWAFITSPQILASYFKTSRYELPWPVSLRSNTKRQPWFKYTKQFVTNRMINPIYIASQLERSSCAKEIGDEEKIASAASKISDAMLANELSVISGFDSIGRNTYLLYGNSQLYDEYQTNARQILDSSEDLRTRSMVRILHGLILKFRKGKNGGSMFLYGKLNDPTDVKRVLYRFEEQVWSTIARLYNLPEQNIRDILYALVSIDLISKKFAEERIELLNNAMGLRWKETILANEQLSSRQNYLSRETYEPALFSAQEEINKLVDKIKNLDEEIDKITSRQKAIENDLNNEHDVNKIQSLKREAYDLNMQHKDLKKTHNKLKADIYGAKKKMAVLEALDPGAEDPAFPQGDIELWQTRYAKMAQDLYRRVIYFVGGLKNIENKHYEIAHPDAFLESTTPDKIDVEQLKNID